MGLELWEGGQTGGLYDMLRCVLLAVMVGSCPLAAEPGACAGGTGALYSRHATVLNHGSLRSPDGKKNLTVGPASDPKTPNGSGLVFTVRVGERKFTAQLAGFDAEVLWSPDSAAFGVTQTEGGGGIGYRVYLFFVGEDGIRRVDVSPLVEKAFPMPGKCEVPVGPNTALVDWLQQGSERVLVAAEVVPVSICQCRGVFRLYEISIPNLRIEASYSQRDAKRKFSQSLGCELRTAADTCGDPTSRK